MPNAQRTDICFRQTNIPGMVPVELKIADKWSGPELFTKLKDQLCGDYMRDVDSTNGIYLLVYHGKKIYMATSRFENLLALRRTDRRTSMLCAGHYRIVAGDFEY